jgi:hypothetical protein
MPVPCAGCFLFKMFFFHAFARMRVISLPRHVSAIHLLIIQYTYRFYTTLYLKQLYIIISTKIRFKQYSNTRALFSMTAKSTLIVWYFVSNKHYFIEQKRGKQKYVIFLVLGKLLKRWIPWWSACESVSPSPSLKTVASLNTTCL